MPNDPKLSQYFVPENKQEGCTKEYLSPSGKYRLIVDSYKSKPGSWNVSQGQVYHDGELISTVQRNYGAFPFTWIENHNNGHDYLLCGRNYQGQTIIELDTGIDKDFLPEEAKTGCGFCRAEERYDRKSQILIVLGCYWAAPYEFKFYDFSDPIGKGLQKLEMRSGDKYAGAYSDDKWPEIDSGAGVIKTYETVGEDDYEEYDEEGETIYPPDNPKGSVKSIKTFVIASNNATKQKTLIFKEEWISESEKAKREAQRIAGEKYRKEIEDFKANDPLYLEYKKQLALPGLRPSDYEGIGLTYKNWSKTWQGDERRMGKRLVDIKYDREAKIRIDPRRTIDLDWAMKTGPVKLTVFDITGNNAVDHWFEHSVKGMQEAFALARKCYAEDGKKKTVWLEWINKLKRSLKG